MINERNDSHNIMKKQLIVLVSVLVVLTLTVVVLSIKSPEFIIPNLPFIIMAIVFSTIISGSIIVVGNKKLKSIEKIILIWIILFFNIPGVIVCYIFPLQ